MAVLSFSESIPHRISSGNGDRDCHPRDEKARVHSLSIHEVLPADEPITSGSGSVTMVA